MLERNQSEPQIRAELSDRFIARGKCWHRTTVRRLIKRVRTLGPRGQIPFEAKAYTTIIDQIVRGQLALIEQYSEQIATLGGLINLVHAAAGLSMLQRCLEGKASASDVEIITRTLIRGVGHVHVARGQQLRPSKPWTQPQQKETNDQR